MGDLDLDKPFKSEFCIIRLPSSVVPTAIFFMVILYKQLNIQIILNYQIYVLMKFRLNVINLSTLDPCNLQRELIDEVGPVLQFTLFLDSSTESKARDMLGEIFSQSNFLYRSQSHGKFPPTDRVQLSFNTVFKEK